MKERETKQDFDVVVVGAGIAGSAAADRLAELGFRVAVLEKRVTPPEKSLYVNGLHFDSPLRKSLTLQGALVPLPEIAVVNADDPSRNWGRKENGGGNVTFALFHQPIVQSLQEKWGDNVEKINITACRSEEYPGKVVVALSNDSELTCSYLVDATGCSSLVSRRHSVLESGVMLEDDPIVMWVRGVRVYGEFQPGILFIPIGRNVGLGWVMPYSSSYGDIMTSDFCRMSELNPQLHQQIFENCLNYCEDKGICHVRGIEDRLVGFVRCEPISKKVAGCTRRVYPIGEAAGMGSPFEAEVVPAALNWGRKLGDALALGVSPSDFHRLWRQKEQMFPYDLELAMLTKRMQREARGDYGSNAPIYKALLSYLPEDAQNQVLTTRRIPRKYLPKLLQGLIGNLNWVPDFIETGTYLAKIKMRNLDF